MKTTGISCMALLLATAVMLPGCSSNGANGSNTRTMAEVSIREAVETADPLSAAEAIYDTLDNITVEQLDAVQLKEKLGVDSADTESFLAYISDPNAGLCDVVFIRPVEEKRDEVRAVLYQYQDRQIEEFRNFDILDSYSIAQNAVIYDQGDYVILLMVPDVESAQELVDEYLPQ